MSARLVAAIALAGCSSGAPTGPQWGRTPATVEVLIDRSDGMQDEAGRACARARELVQSIVDSPQRTRADDLAVYATGTADVIQASRLWTTTFTDLKCIPDSIHGQRCPSPDVDAARVVAVEAFDAACRASAVPTPYSPLFEGISGRVEDLRLRCTGRPCRLVVYSDLLEIHEPGICTAILGEAAYGRRGACPSNGRGASPPPPPDPVDATGVDIVVCGLSDSAEGRRDRMTSEVSARVQQVWPALFPNAASFAIYNDCHGVAL